MRQHSFGALPAVSVLTLGGGGLGMLWGPTTFDECVATVQSAVQAGITLLDLAPRYGNGKAEEVVGTDSTADCQRVFGLPANATWAIRHPARSRTSCAAQSRAA